MMMIIFILKSVFRDFTVIIKTFLQIKQNKCMLTYLRPLRSPSGLVDDLKDVWRISMECV